MKKITLALLVSALFACAVPAQKPLTVKESTDKFTGITETSTDLMKLKLGRSVSFKKHEDKSTKGLSAVTLKYYRDSIDDEPKLRKQWVHIANSRGYLLIDGKSYQLGDGMRSSYTEVKSGLHLIEIVAYILKPEVIKNLSEAKTIEGKVGDSEFTFNSDQVDFIKQFAQKAI